MKKFWKREKSQEEILKDMRTAEQIRLMNEIKKNSESGKPESENLIILKEMNYHSTMNTEDEKVETERSNRRSKVEKVAGTVSPFVVMGCAIWNAKRDSDGENINRTDGGKRVSRMLDSAASRFTEFKNNIVSRFNKK
jgi:hypothetical protein